MEPWSCSGPLSARGRGKLLRFRQFRFIENACAFSIVFGTILLISARAQQAERSNAAAETASAGEEAAWSSAKHASTQSAYLDFAKRFPGSAHIKMLVGTVRGRYWFKANTSFGSGKGRRDGVIVTVEGQSAASSLTPEEAVKLGVLKQVPAGQGKRLNTQGVTFNSVYIEPIGPIVAGGQLITPVDLLNCPVVLSADGTQLLAWDSSKATEARSIYQGATIRRDAKGEFPCGDACPGL